MERTPGRCCTKAQRKSQKYKQTWVRHTLSKNANIASLQVSTPSKAPHSMDFNLRFKALQSGTHPEYLSSIPSLFMCAVSQYHPYPSINSSTVQQKTTACYQVPACPCLARVHRLSENVWAHAQPCPPPESAMTKPGSALGDPPYLHVDTIIFWPESIKYHNPKDT